MIDDGGRELMAQLAEFWGRAPQPEVGRAIGLLRKQFPSRRGFIDRMAELSAQVVGADDSLVFRWERGETSPGSRYRSMVHRVCTAQLEVMSTNTRREFLHTLVLLSGGLLSLAAIEGLRAREPASLRPLRHVEITTAGMLDDLLAHLREQWHALVRADNLLGPRYAVRGVLDQLIVIEDLLASATTDRRHEIVKLAARYAESASWPYEDGGDLATAHYWNGRAMEWAHEAGDRLMLSWTLFRRSQQAAANQNAAEVVSLAQAAARPWEELLPPMRAAIAQQEGQGYALDGDASTAQRRLDDAHRWATTDIDGDARGGHGSFCTPGYIELQRAGSWLMLGQPDRAILLYEATLPHLPAAYHRDRAVALSGMARAYAAIGEPERAAVAGAEALLIAHSAGSVRTLDKVRTLGESLSGHHHLSPVADLLDQLAAVEPHGIELHRA